MTDRPYFAIRTIRKWPFAAITVLALTLSACSSDGNGEGDPLRHPNRRSATFMGSASTPPTTGSTSPPTRASSPSPQGTAERLSESATARTTSWASPWPRQRRSWPAATPPPGANGTGNRGLIESIDSGKTWKTRSLAGEADFHALDYAVGTIYGYDSTNGLLRVSKDGVAWEDRASLQALDIAVDPDTPNAVLATTAQGVAKSSDGGRTFAAGKGPVMAFVSWAKPDALYGIDPSSGLNRSTDGGTTWKKTITVPGGQPQALTVVDARRILAATLDGVYESQDSGKSFTKRLAISSGSH